MRIRKAFLLLLFLCGYGLNAASADDGRGASRPAKKEDLVGSWDMVAVKPVYDKNDPVFYPYQRFVFGKDSSMKFMASEKPFTKQWLDKFAKQPPEIDFTLNEKGFLTLTWQTRPHNETAVCAYVLKDVPPEVLIKIPASERAHLPRKGNVTLSFLNSNGKIAYRKILTRLA